MEILSLEEKALSYSKKILPARKGEYFLDEMNENKAEWEDDYADYIIGNYKRKKSKWKICLLSFFMCLIMCFVGCKMLLVRSDTINVELMSVIENLFTPKDFGKIKFVDTNSNSSDKEAMAYISSLSLPFNSCFSVKSDDVFVLNSPSEITIKCAMDGVVDSINFDEKTGKKTVVVKHKMNLKTEYLYLDNVAVEIGNKVDKNTILGLSFEKQVGFKILYKNSTMKGFEIINGELEFY